MRLAFKRAHGSAPAHKQSSLGGDAGGTSGAWTSWSHDCWMRIYCTSMYSVQWFSWYSLSLEGRWADSEGCWLTDWRNYEESLLIFLELSRAYTEKRWKCTVWKSFDSRFAPRKRNIAKQFQGWFGIVGPKSGQDNLLVVMGIFLAFGWHCLTSCLNCLLCAGSDLPHCSGSRCRTVHETRPVHWDWPISEWGFKANWCKWTRTNLVPGKRWQGLQVMQFQHDHSASGWRVGGWGSCMAAWVQDGSYGRTLSCCGMSRSHEDPDAGTHSREMFETFRIIEPLMRILTYLFDSLFWTVLHRIKTPAEYMRSLVKKSLIQRNCSLTQRVQCWVVSSTLSD